MEKVYPNPFNGQFTVVLTDWEDVILQLSDKSGRIIFQCKAVGRNEIITTGNFSSGIYFLSAIKRGTVETREVVLNYLFD